MLPALWVAKTGLSAQDMNLTTISNNLANVSTTGFKRDRADFEDLLYQIRRQPGGQSSQDSELPTGLQLGTGVRIAGTQKIFTAVSLQTTEQPLDMAVNGRGFFQILQPDGTVSYTRDGTFHLNSDGQIVTSNGNALEPAIVLPNEVKTFTVGEHRFDQRVMLVVQSDQQVPITNNDSEVIEVLVLQGKRMFPTPYAESLVPMVQDTLRRIDALINSAYAHGTWGSSSNSSMDDWRKVMEVNLYGSMNMTQAVVPQMKKQKDGSIVMINTMATRRPNQLEAGYAVSKGALKTAVQYLAEDLGPFGIRVNSTYNGWMWGAPVKGYFQAEAKRQGVPMESLVSVIAQQIPLRNEIPDDADCASAALYLASDYARVVTGAQLDVSGGHYLPH